MNSPTARSAAYGSQKSNFNANQHLYDEAEQVTECQPPGLLEDLLNRLQVVGATQRDALHAQETQWERIMGPEPVNSAGSQGLEVNPSSLAHELSELVERLIMQACNLRSNAVRANNRI